MIETSQNPPNAEDSAYRLRELERQIKEKDALLRSREQTVKDLTDRLALAVERLDRVQRVGTDRITVNTAGFSKEVVQQQTELVADLERAVTQWENVQVGSGLAKLELQLSDVQALIEEHFREPEPEIPEPPETSEPSETNLPAVSNCVAELSSEPHAPNGEPSADVGLDFAVDDVCPLRPPEILNLTEASLPHLKRCVEQQESYINYLSARLQRAAEKSKSVDWDDLAKKPDVLKKQLEHTTTKLEQSRHFAEFEVALQFTRLKRKERELKQVLEELAAQMEAPGKAPEPDQAKDATASRRWMRMLGMGKTESE